MCRHPTAVEQAGGAEQEGAGADRAEAAGLGRRGSKPVDHLLGDPGARLPPPATISVSTGSASSVIAQLGRKAMPALVVTGPAVGPTVTTS